MRVTKIRYSRGISYLAMCSIVIDDCLRLNEVRLYKSKTEASGYNLVFPSKQDVYRDVKKMNGDSEIVLPKNNRAKRDPKKQYEEFFHPLTNEAYSIILREVIKGYESDSTMSKNFEYTPAV